MVDNLKPADRQKTMRAVKGKGTKPERQLFSMLAGMQIRGWKKNVEDIVGKPDVVFVDKQIAIFVDGCFWHGCPHCQRKLPETNREYWIRKIDRNIRRGKTNNQELIDDGWKIIRIWEHEIVSPRQRATIRERILGALTKEQSYDRFSQDQD